MVGVCDVACSDLDLRLLDPNGASVSEDDAGDAQPVLLVTAETSGVFTVEVSMVRCAAASCGWAVQVYADGDLAAGDVRREQGRLEPGDAETRGRYVDEYTVEWRQGEDYEIDLRGDFDTYLEVPACAGRTTTWTKSVTAPSTRSRRRRGPTVCS